MPFRESASGSLRSYAAEARKSKFAKHASQKRYGQATTTSLFVVSTLVGREAWILHWKLGWMLTSPPLPKCGVFAYRYEPLPCSSDIIFALSPGMKAET
jgi:hypothetical protein